MATKKPTPAQLAARKLFAQRVKAGEFKKKPAKKKSITEAVAQMKIWTRNDMDYADAEWKASQMFKFPASKLRAAYDEWDSQMRRKKNPLTRVAVKSLPQRPKGTKKKPTERLVARRTKTAKIKQKGYYANPASAFTHVVGYYKDVARETSEFVGKFSDKKKAVQYAKAAAKAYPQFEWFVKG